MKSILAALPFLTAMCLAAGAQAAVSDGTIITSETLSPLAAWVENATHVNIPALPITTASGHRLQTALSLKGVSRAKAVAAYLPGQIVINNVMWDPDSIRSQSYIVHELVHHTQLISRQQFPCANAKEKDAYTLQNRWLVEHGQEPLVSQEWIERISACGSSGGGDGDD